MVLKVYHFQKRAFVLTVHRVNWRQHRRNCRIGKTKTNKMVFSTEYLVLIRVTRQGRCHLMNNHTASLEITVNMHESLLSQKLMFWTSNWKHVIKYDLYVKFPRIFAHSVQMLNSVVISGYATWFTAGGSIRIAHYDIIDDVITRKL